MATPPKRAYSKLALTPVDILAHLQGKGLSIEDIPSAVRSLETIGYYRLIVYCRALQDGTKRFHPGIRFADIIRLYEFDRRLRLIGLDAIERIEVALRASINNRLAVAHGPHFYMKPEQFERFRAFQRFAGHAANAQHPLTKHYYDRYTAPDCPPIWVLTEVLSFGKLSVLFADLTIKNRKLVATDLGFPEGLLVSWLRCLADFRNRCAHHERIWNARMLASQPTLAKVLPELCQQDRFYARAVLIVALLRVIEPGEAWRNQLKDFIAGHGFVNLTDMGFPAGWETMPFWA